MASCPKCETQELNPRLMSPGLPALGCETCDGALVSLISYRTWREAQDLPTPASKNTTNTNASENNNVACLCPKCRALMSKYRFSENSVNQLDYCAHCQEVWFDHGEWALIEELELSAELTQIFTRPWQYALNQKQIADDTLARWKARFGADFDKLHETKQWVHTHPNKYQMLAYLNSIEH